jgi:hypothetical protein
MLLRTIIASALLLPLVGMQPDIEQGVVVHTRRRALSRVMIEEEVIYENMCSLIAEMPVRNSSSDLFRMVLRDHIHAALDSPHEEDRTKVRALTNPKLAQEHQLKLFMHEFFLRVTADALSAAERDLKTREEELTHNVSKRKAAYLAIASSTVTALASVGAALLMHYTD